MSFLFKYVGTYLYLSARIWLPVPQYLFTKIEKKKHFFDAGNISRDPATLAVAAGIVYSKAFSEALFPLRVVF